LTFDVIVVGAGPAGSTAAKLLGEAGISTLLLDKSAFPRDKPCGGGISARAIQRFPYLESALANIPVNWVSKVYLESPAGFSVDHRSETPLYLMIRRCEFDNLLLSLACKHVEFKAPALVRKVSVGPFGAIVTADVGGEIKDYQCKLVLGCDGANSVVARASGLRTGSVQDEYAIDMMEETPYEELNLADRDRMYIYYRIRSHYGYGYVFPKASHVNLGVGFKLDYYLSKLRGEHYAHHSSFIDGLVSNGLVAGRSNRVNFRAFPLPISGPLGRTYSDRILVSGDAGGFVNALTAEGIYYAMLSGDHAARTAIEAVKANDFTEHALSRYQESWKQEAGVELEKSVRFQKLLLSDSKRIDRIVRAAGRNPTLADLLARYATGSLAHAEFKRALIRRALPIYIRELVGQVSDLSFF
jgi:geranylgeranyl reductase family protein